MVTLNTAGKQPADYEQKEAADLAKYKEPFRRGGIKSFLEYELKEFGQLPVTRDPNEHYGLGLIYALLERPEKALDSLEKALENRAFLMAWVKAEPIFDNLRKHPRFKAILQKMNLPPDA